MKKRFILMMTLIIVVFCILAAASANQNNSETWCNADEYGCWVVETDESGSEYHSYVMYWDEGTRQAVLNSRSQK